MLSISSLLTACSLVGAVVAQAPTVSIDIGQVVGTTTNLPTATASVNKFLGIPFAQSPPQRFSPPVAPAKAYAPINATAWKPACIQQFMCKSSRCLVRYLRQSLTRIDPLASQQFTELVFNTPAPQESEDCLYLNVYAPAAPAAGEGRAVMFWIYGGSLQFGTAGQPTYDGSHFAAYEDVIVVTTNYRTNGELDQCYGYG